MAAKQSDPGTKKITFKFSEPGAKTVSIVGDFNQWQPGLDMLKSSKSGEFTISLNLKPGRYAYKFLADKGWYNDSFAQEYTYDEWGNVNSVITVN
jgi:1,4-alpha-glucan branching enzyme